MPILKNARYSKIETINSACSSKYIDSEIKHRDKKIKGNVLNIMYLRPSWSIMKMAINDPIALVAAKGMFRRMPISSLSSPSKVMPESIII